MDSETLGDTPGLYVQRAVILSLRHQIGARRRTRPVRGAHRLAPAPEIRLARVAALEADTLAQASPTAAPGAHTAAEGPGCPVQQPLVVMREPHPVTPEPPAAAPGSDTAARRVREAGGPSDLATYACECGYLFAASVTTTVGCPHCGTAQAW